MISLVITIILIIILASVTFLGSKSTIDNATYSTYVNNVSEVVAAFEKTTLDMNSEEELIKDPKLDEQIFNYVARGGENLEFLEYEELPVYTVMVKEVNIGMELPEMKVESGTGRVIPIKYASTMKGKIFTWPPYEHEGKLYITQDDTVEHKMQTEITVGSERLTIIIDSGDGSLLDAVPGEGYYDPEWDEDLPFESETPEETPSTEAHLFTQKTPTTEYLASEATCTSPAKYYYKCISCDAKGTNTYSNGTALGHEWDTYKVTKNPNCRDTGTKERTCQTCGEVELVSISKDMKTHIGEQVEEITRVASCTETERKTTKCSACNVVLKVQEGEKNPDNHSGGESAQITKQVTCTEDGTKVTTCVGCNKVLRTEAIPAFGHTFGPFVVTKESTCSVKGTRQRTCSTCGVNETEELALDSSNHKGSTTGEERTEPTCTANGKVDKKCSLCGGVLSTQTLAALGHSYKSVVTEPTLEADGYTTHTCTRCGDSYVDSYVPKLVITAFAVYSETDNSLRFYKNTDTVNVGDTYKNLKVTEKYLDIETTDYENVSDIPWTDYSGDILKVIVEEEIIPISTKRWFAGFTNATSMDLTKLNTSKVTTMRQMFRACSSIQTLSINHFDTSEVTDMYAMFWGAISLENLDLSNWNTSKVTDMAYMFGAYEEEMALKEIDLSSWNTESLTNTRVMFQNCTNIQEINLTGWKTGKVTQMDYMFFRAGKNSESFEILGLNNIDTSSVSTMGNMFYHAGTNATTWSIGDLSAWDTSSVTEMSSMFYAAGNNVSTWSIGDLSNWDTSKVKFFDCTFAYAGENATSWSVGDLSNWNTSSALNMTSMFAQAGQNATTFDLGNLDNWDTSKVINISNLFSNAGKNSSTWNVGDLSKWNTSNVTNMYQMFAFTGLKASTFDIGDLSTKTVTKADGTTYTAWDTSKVTNMAGMFSWGGYGASTFDIGDVGTWDVSSVKSMRFMFNQAGLSATTWNIGDLSSWNVSNVTDMAYAFSHAGINATTWNIGDLSNWDTSKVTTMSTMFYKVGENATEVTLNVSNWNTSNVKNMTHMFQRLGRTAAPINLDLSNWDTSKVTYAENESGEIISGMKEMLTGMEHLHTITLGANFSTTGDGTCTFSLPTIDTSYFTESDGLWYDIATGIGYAPDAIPTNTAATYSVEPPIEAFAIYSETDNSLRFYKNMDHLNLSEGDTYKDLIVTNVYTGVEDVEYTTSVETVTTPWIEHSGEIITVRVEEEISPISTAGMFAHLKKVTSLNLSNLNTSKATNFSDMFFRTGYDATTFEIIGLENFDTSKATNMKYVFQESGYNATSWKIGNIGVWDVSNVTDITSMFSKAGYNAEEINLNLSDWDTNNLEKMYSAFEYLGYNSDEVVLDVSNLNILKVTSLSNVFNKVGYNALSVNVKGLATWDTSNITSMSSLFNEMGYNTSELKIEGISEWNTTSVTNMAHMFLRTGCNANIFDTGDLSTKTVTKSDGTTYTAWDVSNVKDASWLFDGAGREASTYYIGDLSNWNTSQMTNMSAMFLQAGTNDVEWYVGDLSTKIITRTDGTTYTAWDVSNVKNMHGMFTEAGYNATTFNIGNIGNWNTSNVTSMTQMFWQAGYNSSTFDLGNLDNWDISKVTSIDKIFGEAGHNATTFNIGDISNWNTSSVTDMYGAFVEAGYNASSFNIGTLSGWNTANVTDMRRMFYGTGRNSSGIILDLSNWDTSNVTYSESTSGYQMSGIEDMFTNMRRLKTITLGEKFSFTGDGTTSCSLPTIDTTYFTESDGLWYDIATGIGYAPDAIPSNTAATYSVEKPVLPEAYAVYSATDNSLRFYNNNSMPSVGSTYEGRVATSVYTGFEEDTYTYSYDSTVGGYKTTAPWFEHYEDITTIVVEEEIKPTSTANWFVGLKNLSTGEFSNLNTVNVTDMSNMFYFTASNSSIFDMDGLSEWDTSSVVYMYTMFHHSGYNATTWDVGDLSSWDTSSVTNMSNMFSSAGYNSEGITLNLSGWDTSSLDKTSSESFNGMGGMFDGMRRLETITLGADFSTTDNGTSSFSLPEIDTSYFTDSDGKWYNTSTKVGYAPDAIPTNTAATYSVEVPKLGEFECTSCGHYGIDGYTEYCSRCNIWYGECICAYCGADFSRIHDCPYEACDAGNHTYGEYITTTEATCTSTGTQTATCSVCGATTSMSYGPNGHSYYQYSSTSATCETKSSVTYRCSSCGDTYTEYGSYASCSYYQYSSTSGTCTTAGTITYKCSYCGDTYSTSGSYGSCSYYQYSSTSGTCTTAGTITYKCSYCGDTYTSSGSYGSHSYSYTCSTALTDAGCTLQECANCGATTGSHIEPCTHMVE